jgi:hypothetical protein
MSGFVTSTFQYPSFGTSPTPGAHGCGGGKKSNLITMPRTNPGLGDLTTIGTDLSNGDIASVISDLLPWASTTNVILYALGIGAWLFMGRGSDEKNRQERSAALKKLDLQYQLQKQAIDQKFPVKKKSKKKGAMASLFA